MNSFWLFIMMLRAYALPVSAVTFDLDQAQTGDPGQTEDTSRRSGIPGQTPVNTNNNNPGAVSAFPNSPRAKPARVRDIAVPPPVETPGSLTGQGIGDSSPLTADEAVQIAIHQQPSLGVQTGSIFIRQGQTLQIGASEHPQLSLGGGYDRVQSLSGSSSGSGSGSGSSVGPQASTQAVPEGASAIYPFSVNAVAKQLIYDFNMTRNLVKQSEALERSAAQDLTVAELTLAVDVRSDFYNYVSAIRLVHVDEENIANRQRQLNLASSRFRNGIGEPSDLATAQTSKSQGIIQLNQARNTAEHSRITLLQQMGIDPLTPVVPLNETAPDVGEKDAHTLTTKAIKTRPEVKSAFEALVAARYGLSAARAVDMPQIFAEVGSAFNGTSLPFSDNVANFAIGFQFPVIDGGTRAGAVKSAKGQIMTASANYQTAVLQVRTDVANAYMDLKSAEQRVVVADNEALNAREDVRVAEGRYEIGIGLFQDITTAQSLLLTALNDQESARNSLDLARTQLQRATGELLKKLH